MTGCPTKVTQCSVPGSLLWVTVSSGLALFSSAMAVLDRRQQWEMLSSAREWLWLSAFMPSSSMFQQWGRCRLLRAGSSARACADLQGGNAVIA